MPMPLFVTVPIRKLCSLNHESSIPATWRAWHSAWTSLGHDSVNLTLNRNKGHGEGGQIVNYSSSPLDIGCLLYILWVCILDFKCIARFVGVVWECTSIFPSDSTTGVYKESCEKQVNSLSPAHALEAEGYPQHFASLEVLLATSDGCHEETLSC